MIEQAFHVGPDSSVHVRIASGKLDVRRGQPGMVLVRATGGGADHLTIEQRGSTVWVAMERRSSWVDRSVYVTLEVPDGIDLDANVASADVDIDPPVGRLSINSASGDIRFGTAGELDVKTASGEVHGMAVEGRVNFVSASGDLTMESLGDRAELSTASGDIRVDTAVGTVGVSTMSGDVHITRFQGPELRAKGMSGNVALGIPAGTTVDLEATTLSGDIRLPQPSSEHHDTTRTVRVGIRLVSGDVRIQRV